MKNFIAAMLVTLLVPMTVYAETATFYAKRFSGRPMANGKVYHPHKMVAAHPRYRLGTKLRVTNRKTGKSVKVVVSDRCNCSLDLSPAAFKRIGRLGQGRISVKVAVSG